MTLLLRDRSDARPVPASFFRVPHGQEQFQKRQSTSAPTHLPVTRRDFLATSTGTAHLYPRAVSAGESPAVEAGPYQATGARVGEVTENSTIVWTRLMLSAGGQQCQIAFQLLDVHGAIDYDATFRRTVGSQSR